MKKIIWLIEAVLTISLFLMGCSDEVSQKQMESEAVVGTSTIEVTETVEGKEEISYKSVTAYGCSFLIPEGYQESNNGRSVEFYFDKNTYITMDFNGLEITDWTEVENSIFNNLRNNEENEVKARSSEIINDNQVFKVEFSTSGYELRTFCINANNRGVFSIVYVSPSADFPYQNEVDKIISSFDASGIDGYIASRKAEEENDGDSVSASRDQITEQETETETEEEKPSESAAKKEKSTEKSVSNNDLGYDEDGYIIVTYANRERLADMDRPNVHLSGTLVDANNICFTIKDEGGHTWTGESAGGHDFTEYIGTECDIYGFCTGGISSRYNTPLVDMAYKDSHISFEDGKSYYPKDSELSDEFPGWNFENERESSNATVWIPTDGGTKYHSYEGCSGMENPEQVTESEAISRGYERCGKCW